MQCRECRSEMELTQLPAFVGSEKNIVVTFTDLPCYVCPNQCDGKNYADPEFGSQLINILFFIGKVPVTRTKGGLFRKKQRCYHCTALIEDAARRPGKVSGTIEIPKLPAFSITIEAPEVICRSCGTSQIYADDQVSFLINEAIVNAFKTIDLRP